MTKAITKTFSFSLPSGIGHSGLAREDANQALREYRNAHLDLSPERQQGEGLTFDEKQALAQKTGNPADWTYITQQCSACGQDCCDIEWACLRAPFVVG